MIEAPLRIYQKKGGFLPDLGALGPTYLTSCREAVAEPHVTKTGRATKLKTLLHRVLDTLVYLIGSISQTFVWQIK